MSWSVGVPATPAADFAAAVEALTLPEPWAQDSDELEAVTAAQGEQLAAAKAAALALWRSGAVGSPESGYYGVQLNGHATPGHGAPHSFANDTVGASVWQTYAPAPKPSSTASGGAQ